MKHSFLLIGQSNAAGRGFLQEAAPLENSDKKLMMMRNGRWQKMFRPINPDRSFSGTSLAESFARAYVNANPETEACIIPCADGGTKLNQWMPGEILFENAVNCARLAMRTSRLVGVLWHQGEGDSTEELHGDYAERFAVMMNALRKELGIPDLPVVVGGLGDFLADYERSEQIGRYYPYVNAQLEKLGREYPHCRFVSAKGLGANPDNLHFSAAALEEFGVRYFEEFSKMELPDNATEQEPMEDSVRTKLEEL